MHNRPILRNKRLDFKALFLCPGIYSRKALGGGSEVGYPGLYFILEEGRS